MVRCSFRRFRRHRCCWRTPWTSRNQCQHRFRWRRGPHGRCSIQPRVLRRSRCSLNWRRWNPSTTGFQSTQWNCWNQRSNSRPTLWHWGFHNTRRMKSWRIDSRWPYTEHRHTRRSNLHCSHMVRCSCRYLHLRCCWRTPWTSRNQCQHRSRRHRGPHWRCSILLEVPRRSKCSLSWRRLNPSMTGSPSTRWNCSNRWLSSRAPWWRSELHNTRTKRWWRIDSPSPCMGHKRTRWCNLRCFHKVNSNCLSLNFSRRRVPLIPPASVRSAQQWWQPSLPERKGEGRIQMQHDFS